MLTWTREAWLYGLAAKDLARNGIRILSRAHCFGVISSALAGMAAHNKVRSTLCSERAEHSSFRS
jgi:hypothetical protein